MLSLTIALVLSCSASASSKCDVYPSAPFGLKGTSALILADAIGQNRLGHERLHAFVLRARPDRREVADQVVRLLGLMHGRTDHGEFEHVADSLLTYLIRSPRIAPDYLELITTALFARFELAESANSARRDLGKLDEALTFYLDLAARHPKIATVHFKPLLTMHLHTFVSDDILRLEDMADDTFEDRDEKSPLRRSAREIIRATADAETPRLAHPEDPHSENAVLVFWLRLTARVSRTLPGLSDHPLLRTTEHLRIRLRKMDETTANHRELVRQFDRVSAEVAEWFTGLVRTGREAAHQRWVYYGRPDDWRYLNIITEHVQEPQIEGVQNHIYEDESETESEPGSRLRRAAEFPDSAAHRHLTEFAGPNVTQVERGSRKLPVPPQLRALADDLPDRLHFNLAQHYDEHIWQRAEGRRHSPGYLRKRPPEYVVDVFERLIGEIQAAGQRGPNESVRRTLLEEAALI